MLGKKNILIVCPELERRGGVSFYYSAVQKHFFSGRAILHYYYVGVKDENCSFAKRLVKFFYDLAVLSVRSCQYSLIVFNPSLNPKSVIRDGLFHVIVRRLYKMKTIVFFRGWGNRFEKIVDIYFRKVFKFVFSADRIIVLSNSYRETLRTWGYRDESIVVESTTFEDHPVLGGKDRYKLAFLSRLVENKGGLGAIQAVEMLVKEYAWVKLFIIGDGNRRETLEKYVAERKLDKNVEFTGWVSGWNKCKLLAECGIMIYPTTFAEGMPNSVIEGFGLGLVIVSRPVGGLADIIVDGENGFLLESLDPREFARKIKVLFDDEDLWLRMSRKNRHEGKNRYEVKCVVRRLEKLFLEVAR